MWATQLRNYTQHSNKISQQSKRGGNSCENTGGSQNDADSTGGGPVSPDSQSSNKNLDKCAQLLSDMLRQDPGTKLRQAKEVPKATKATASGPQTRRVRKANLVVKPKRINDRGTKPAASKKQVTINTKPMRRKENALDSVSETSTELQVRLTGPKPLPLNNSETIVQVTGKEPEPVPKLSSGQVVMTNVPYNDRILCSTPMSSPNAKSAHGNPSQHQIHHYAPVSQGYFHSGQISQAPPRTRQPQCGHSLYSSSRSDYPTDLSQPDPHPKPAENVETLAAMKDYIASSDDHLSSFLKNYLGQVQQPESQQSQDAPVYVPTQRSRVLTEVDKQKHSREQAQYPLSTGNTLTSFSSSMPYGTIEKPTTSHSTGNGSAVRGTGLGMFDVTKGLEYKAPATSDVDIDAILRTHGITLNGKPGPTSGPNLTDHSYKDILSNPLPPKEFSTQPNVTHSNPAYDNKLLYPEAFTSIPERDVDLPLDNQDKENLERHDETEETDTKAHKTKRHKSSKKEKEKQKKSSSPKTAVSKTSPGDVKTQVRTLLYLFGELKAVTSLNKDKEVQRLLGDMEVILGEVSPGISTSGLSTDLDLALQPLRSENAQLRRRIRILTQQFKEKCQAAEDASKPDPNFQVIHLELQRHSLETQLKEESDAKEKLQAAIKSLALQIQGLMKERQSMVQILSTKDNDHLKAQQDWVGEAGKLRTQLKAVEQNMKEKQAKLDSANTEVTLLEVTLKQKNKEIDRLRALVKDLQGSMSRLLDDLRGNTPRTLPVVDDISHYLQNIDTLLRPEKPNEANTHPTREEVAAEDLLSKTPIQSLASALADPSPYNSPLQHLVEAIPDLLITRDDEDTDVEGGLERAYRLLDRIDAAITPEVVQGSQSQSHSTPEKADKSSRRTKASRQAWTKSASPKHKPTDVRKSEEKEIGRRMSSPKKGSTVRATGFDPEHDNYQGKLTQELLMEHDRQNGVDDEVIERMLTRSNHSQRPGDHVTEATAKKYSAEMNRGAKPEGSHRHTLKIGDKSDLSDAQSKPKFKGAHGRLGSDSDFDKQSGLTGILSPGDLDTTEYLNPPPQKGGRPSSKGPTVKELLAPLANRMMGSKNATDKLSGVYEEGTSDLTSGTLSTETDYGGEGDNVEGDSTLVEEEEGEEKRTIQSRVLADESRYSLTDYFKKYPSNRPITASNSGPEPRAFTKPVPRLTDYKPAPTAPMDLKSPSEEKSITDKMLDDKPFSPMSFVTTSMSDSPADLTDLSKLSFSITSSSGVLSRETPSPPPDSASEELKTIPQRQGDSQNNAPEPALAKSPQDHLYKGTELDTSLSTIQEAETNSVFTTSSITSLTTTTSVDEMEFKSGLAKLDANIARIQESLKKSTR